MKKLKAGVRWLLAKPSLCLAILFPNPFTLGVMCVMNRFLTTGREVNVIVQALKTKGACNFLVFGLGNDSVFYRARNPGGRTIFLEDHEDWLSEITVKHPQLEAYRIGYKTKLGEWRSYLKSVDQLKTDLPDVVSNVRWDVIFVDGPMGFLPHHPGRMESLRLASILVNRPGDVFVHDCDREVEDGFSTHYLKAENLQAKEGNLRHYILK